MFKLIKWLLILLLVLLVLIIGSITVAVVTVDPNEFKPQITEQAKKHLGRDLHLAGDIGWSFYPWLGLDLGKTSMANAAGFNSQPFAEFEKVDVKVKLLPLLKKSLQARQITIHGAALNLQKDAQGNNNWSDIAKNSQQNSETQENKSTASKPDIKIRINGIKITDAKILYSDQSTDSQITINPLNLSTGTLEIGKPVKINSDFVFTQQGLYMAADLSATISADLDNGHYKVDNLDIKQIIKTDGLPEQGITLTQNLSMDINTNSQKITVVPLNINTSGLTLDGKLNIDQFIDNPRYSGHFNSNQFNPKEIISTFGIAAPNTSDKTALSNASVEFDLSGTTNSITLNKLQAQLDDSKLTGTFSLLDIASQSMKFNLVLDQLNVDRYLSVSTPPENNEGASPSASRSGSSDKIVLPIETIRKLDIEGDAKIQSLLVKKLKFTDSSVAIKAKDGKIKVAPLSAQAYQGKAVINASLDAQSNVPAYKINADLAGVRSEEILETLFGERYITGSAGLKMDLATAADSVSGLQNNLNGNFKAKFLDGTVKGSKLSVKINEARNFWRKLSGKSEITEDITEDTKFSSLTASGNVSNGIVSNNDLKILAPVFQAKGEGEINLPEQSVNYTLSLADDGGKGTDRVFVPLQIVGKFDDLKFRLRGDSVLKDRAKQELDAEKAKLKARADEEKAKLKAKLEKEKSELKAELEAKKKAKKAELDAKATEKKEELKEQVEDKKQELEKKLEEKLKNRLKGLF